MKSRTFCWSVLSGSAKSRESHRASHFSLAFPFPPCSISSISATVHFEMEIPLILWLNSRWIPLHDVHTNVKKFVHT